MRIQWIISNPNIHKIQEDIMKKEAMKNNKSKMFTIIRNAKLNTVKKIEESATEVGKSLYISPRDACTCTGNCPTAA